MISVSKDKQITFSSLKYDKPTKIKTFLEENESYYYVRNCCRCNNNRSSNINKKLRMEKRARYAHQTKKGGQWYFGMKTHIDIDSKNGIVQVLLLTLLMYLDIYTNNL